MLVKPMKSADLEGDVSKVQFPCWGSPKLDGYRATVQECPEDQSVGGRVYWPVVLSNNLKPIRNRFIQKILSDDRLLGMDGELIVGDPADDPFNRTSSGVTRAEGEPDFKLYVFDNCLPISRFPNLNFSTRYEHVKRRIHNLPAKLRKHVEIVEHQWIETASELEAYELKCLEAGYEGVMTRSSEGVYKEGRSTVKENWLCKLKRFKDAEAVVLGVAEQMHNTNPKTTNALGHSERSSHKAGKVGKDTLGSLHVRGLNGMYEGRKFDVGTGFTDDQRAALWREASPDRTLLNGKIIKYKYFPTGSVEAPRFPVFLGWRDEGDM
jgi:DNA ligase 1